MWEWLVFLVFLSWILALIIFLSSNPVLSVICLIYIYILSSMVLYCYNLEFFGYSYLIVYVGVILVLFLLIVMLTQPSILSKVYLFNSISKLSLFLFVCWLFWLVGKELVVKLYWEGYIIVSCSPFIDFLFEFIDPYLEVLEIVELGEDLVRRLGVLLYTSYFFYLIVGLLLLLIGCIVVSLWLGGQSRKDRKLVDNSGGTGKNLYFGKR